MKNKNYFESVRTARSFYNELFNRTRDLGGYKVYCGFDEWMSSELKAKDFMKEEANCADDASPIFKDYFEPYQSREVFAVLPLDANHKTICAPLIISMGLLNGVPAGAREVFREAVLWDASAIIVAHNHPSGDPTPSKKDIILTNELIAASRILRIPILDHIIIGDDTYVSLNEEKYCDFDLGKGGDNQTR